ncbi:MAG: PQQ-dependent sugar dehydrogenase, partial [Planctomycetota bacterium]
MKLAQHLVLAAAVAACPAATAQITTEVIASGLSRPVFVTHAPGDFDRIFVVEQRTGSTGRIRIIELASDTLLPTPFLTQSVNTANEEGLLGLAFHPDYATNGKFYINYTTSSGGRRTIVDEFTVDPGNPNLADPTSRRQIITISQPFSNHNGGWIEFG